MTGSGSEAHGESPGPRHLSARKSLRIGLTGPIGCGKSTVAGWLSERGAAVVDADAIAREVTEPGEPTLAEVLARFGDGVRTPDGSLDRAALGRIVFADPARLHVLESIIHPAVRPRLLAAVEAAERDGVRVVVIEAIKLVEGGLAELCDETWLVTCGPDDQRERLLSRGADERDAVRRIAAQAGMSERLRAVATRVIDTSGERGQVRRKVERALDEALASAAGMSSRT